MGPVGGGDKRGLHLKDKFFEVKLLVNLDYLFRSSYMSV